MPIIDVWMQHPTRRFLDQPFFDSLKRWTKNDQIPDVPLEATVGAMQHAGVSKGLIAAWHGPMGSLISNDEVAECIAKYPEQLVGLASADLFKPMDSVRELRRRVKDQGFKGLRIVPWLWGLPPDDRRYYPLFAECCELDVPFCTQIGHTGPLMSSEPGRPMPYLENVALEFPELKIVAGHVGSPWLEEAILMARKFPNFYIDTSAYAANRFPAELVKFMQGRGISKVMFGTNFPMLTAAQCLKGLDDLGLSDEAKAQYLYSNAAEVFKLDIEA